ncbi:MAG: hypothetical protein E7208_03655 [Clostridium butyricum]|nr:hypothetical protein [Clostridium butyricum]
MANLYGGTLTILDGFTRTLNNFESKFKKSISTFENTSKKISEKASDNFNKSFEKINKNGSNTFNNLTKNMNNFSNSGLSMISKLTAGYLSLRGITSTLFKGIDASKEFENAKMFLDAVYQGNGTEKYKFATKFANETPFEEGEVASGLARAKALGLGDTEDDMKFYGDLGSMAKITGTGDLSSAIDALADASQGEWTRLQTILGVKRTSLEEFADSKGMDKFTNKQGQVTDSKQALNVIKSYMDDKGLSGITEKYAKTFSGRISTLTGNLKKSLAELMGITEDGEVRDGSLFDNMAKGLEKIITSINKFAKSEGAEKVGRFLGEIGNKVNKFIDYLTENPEAVENLLKIGGALAGLKVISGLISPITDLTGVLGGSGGLGSALTALSGKSLMAGGAILALSSLLSENGVLHKGVNSIINDIAGNSEDEQKDYLYMSMRGWQYGGLEALKGVKSLFGADTSSIDTKIDKMQKADVMDSRLFPENTNKYKNGYSAESFPTSSSLEKNQNTNTNNNQVKVNINVDKVEKTADIDEVMDTFTRRMNTYYNTRNAIGGI